MPSSITLAPDPVHLVSCTQHTSIFLLANVSTTSADLPDTVPMFQVANLKQTGTLEVFFCSSPPASLQGIRSIIYVMTGTPSCRLDGFPIVLFLVGRWGCPVPTMIEVLRAVPRPFLLSSILNKEELKQSFCDRMPFLSPTSRNHLLDLIFSLSTKTPEQRRDVTPFTSILP